jgi:UDP-N-acetylglucosamine transferase subunit ALG13
MIVQPLVFVTVGSDHHRFDRLMAWTEEWLASVSGNVECVVQHMTSRLPLGARGQQMYARDQMLDLMRHATVVVGQGGPGTIMDARSSGRLPVVVPRLSRLSEAVDDHQVAFTRRLAQDGYVKVAESVDALRSELDRALAEPSAYTVADGRTDISGTIARFGSMVENLVERGGRSASRPRPAHRLDVPRR